MVAPESLVESNIGLAYLKPQDLNKTILQVAKQLCLSLYWLKYSEDCKLYFKRNDIKYRVHKAINSRVSSGQSALSSGEEDDESSSDSDDSGEDLGSLTDFLLDTYKNITPQIFDVQKNDLVEGQKVVICGTPADKYYSRLSYQLDIHDEFADFKKFFVTALDQDRDRIKSFIKEDPELEKITDFVFRCRRIRFSADHSQDQIRLIYNFQM